MPTHGLCDWIDPLLGSNGGQDGQESEEGKEGRQEEDSEEEEVAFATMLVSASR
jgi:hypothetical protein